MQIEPEENWKKHPKPAKFEYGTGPSRIVYRASLAREGRPSVEVGGGPDGCSMTMRLTAKRARDLSKWLIRYAEWADNIPNQGGR